MERFDTSSNKPWGLREANEICLTYVIQNFWRLNFWRLNFFFFSGDCLKNEQLAGKQSFEGKCEILRTISLLRVLSSNICTSKPERDLFNLQSSDNFSRQRHQDHSSIFCGFFMFLCAELSASFFISPSLASANLFFCFP